MGTGAGEPAATRCPLTRLSPALTLAAQTSEQPRGTSRRRLRAGSGVSCLGDEVWPQEFRGRWPSETRRAVSG